MLLLSHAAAKAAMFLAAGSIQRAAGHDRIRDLDGITHVLPVSAFTIGLAGISLVGLPPTAGFVGKWLLLGSSLAQGQWWWVVVILAGILLWKLSYTPSIRRYWLAPYASRGVVTGPCNIPTGGL